MGRFCQMRCDEVRVFAFTVHTLRYAPTRSRNNAHTNTHTGNQLQVDLGCVSTTQIGVAGAVCEYMVEVNVVYCLEHDVLVLPPTSQL